MSFDQVWTTVVDKARETRARCFTDPLEEEGLNWFSNFSLNIKAAAGAVPGVAKLVAHAFIPGLCQDALKTFTYKYYRCDSRDIDHPKDE